MRDAPVPRARLLGIVVVLALCALSDGASVEAQRRQGPPRRHRVDLERRVRQRMAQMVRQQLGLSDERARLLNEAVAEFQDDRDRLAERRRNARRRMNAVMRGQVGVSDQEMEGLLAELAELREEEARIFREEQERLLQVLTPAQVLRFNVLREQLGERVRRLRGGQGPPGGPPGAGSRRRRGGGGPP